MFLGWFMKCGWWLMVKLSIQLELVMVMILLVMVCLEYGLLIDNVWILFISGEGWQVNVVDFYIEWFMLLQNFFGLLKIGDCCVRLCYSVQLLFLFGFWWLCVSGGMVFMLLYVVFLVIELVSVNIRLFVVIGSVVLLLVIWQCSVVMVCDCLFIVIFRLWMWVLNCMLMFCVCSICDSGIIKFLYWLYLGNISVDMLFRLLMVFRN